MAVSLLLLVPLFTVQGPPRLQWFSAMMAPPPPPPAPVPPAQHPSHPSNSNLAGDRVIEPPRIPDQIAILNEREAPAAPDIDQIGVAGGTGRRGPGVMDSIGNAVSVAPSPPPTPVTRIFKRSTWAEGNLVHKVQPVYPPIAIQARIQGAVLLRAVISKNGTIENLAVESGHPMLVKAAIEAVRQWRYRPYFLNNEPIEIETEITVNFVLGGS